MKRGGRRRLPPGWGPRSRACCGWSSGPAEPSKYALGVRVTVCDVGPRDGLQNEPETLAPAVRAELVNRLRQKHEGGQEIISGADVEKLSDILSGRTSAGPMPGGV